VTHAFNHHVSEADAFTLQLERDPGLRATIVAVILLDGPVDWSRLVDRMDRATRLVPTFRERLVATPLRLAAPRWLHDEDFDLSWHLRRLRIPAGSGLPGVLDFARGAAMDAFDHDRPLWQFTLLEGWDQDRAALVLKVHHALTDGIGGVQIAAHVVDGTRDGEDLGQMPPAPSDRAMLPFESLAEAVGHDVRHLVDQAQGLVRRTPGALWGAVRDPVGASLTVLDDARSVARMVRPVTFTRSPVMRDRRLGRHLELLDVELESLRAAGAVADGTLNDAFVAAIAGGMRLYHQAHCACVSELRVTMPISTRAADADIGGNHVTLVRFDLPVGITDPVARMAAVHEICRRERDEQGLQHSEAVAGALNLLPVTVSSQMLRHVDLLASNVPGLTSEVYLAGAKVEGFYPFGATLGSAANITLMSYRGTCHVGINTDAGAVPDPEVFRQSLVDGFEEVLASAR
jgi:diacylglycerol O-acyltransferase